jgi:hypothetical protein
MIEIDRCGGCGVPAAIGTGLRWENNGVISIVMSRGNRVVFYESETIDRLFLGIQELIGLPIEHIVIESKRRETRGYVETLFPTDDRDEMLSIDGGVDEFLGRVRQFNAQVELIGRIYGYGDVDMTSTWDASEAYPWRIQKVRNPYSVSFNTADTLGTVEALEDRDLWVERRDLGGGCYEVRVEEGAHPVELKERLQHKRYGFKPGIVTFERCPSCGVPAEVGRCRWDLEAGTITDPVTGRRMAFFGSGAMDAVLEDLAAELGEELPHLAVEAQRRFVRSYMGGEDWKRSGFEFKNMVALRGLGDMIRFKAKGRGTVLTINNSCLHLPMVGFVQALVEAAVGVDQSEVEWDVGGEGVLTVEVRV